MPLSPDYLQALPDRTLDAKWSLHVELIATAGFPGAATVAKRHLEVARTEHPTNNDLHRQVKIFSLLNIAAIQQEHYDPQEAQKK